MASTVIGLFDSQGEAAAVEQALADARISLSDIRITSPVQTRSDDDWNVWREEFRGLGAAQSHYYYEEGIRRGGTLVTVSVPDDRADEIALLLRRHNAIDIENRAAEWHRGGWSGGVFDTAAVKNSSIADSGRAAGL